MAHKSSGQLYGSVNLGQAWLMVAGLAHVSRGSWQAAWVQVGGVGVGGRQGYCSQNETLVCWGGTQVVYNQEALGVTKKDCEGSEIIPYLRGPSQDRSAPLCPWFASPGWVYVECIGTS